MGGELNLWDYICVSLEALDLMLNPKKTHVTMNNLNLGQHLWGGIHRTTDIF